MDHIKQLRIYPPENGKCDLIVIYEIEEPEQLSQNEHYLSVDLGLHNLMTCYDSENGRTFILGRKYLSLERYFHKEIARVQVCMVRAAVGKKNKISKIIETYPETLQEKAECSEGLPSQSDQMDCRILQKRRHPLCGCGRHPKYPQRKGYGA